MTSAPAILRNAHVLCYRLFDIADEVDLQLAERLIVQGSRMRLERERSQYLQLPNPPLAVNLGPQMLPLKTGAVVAQTTARVFDHGALSIIFKIDLVPGLTTDELVPVAEELYDSTIVEEAALSWIAGLREQLAPALEDSHLWSQSESYTIFFAQEVDGHPTAEQLLDQVDLARILLGEGTEVPLSAFERGEVTRHRFSYTESDLVVVDWNSAFVYEPSGSTDIPDLLEVVNAQLLELRYYDDLLDKQLQVTYDEIQRKQRSWASFFRSPYRLLARRVSATLFELSEFTERVENSLKIVGDFYLANVYEAGVKRLRIRSWQASVTRKQQMLAQVYQLLKGEVDTDRALTLEVTIVLLIVSELLLASLRAVF